MAEYKKKNVKKVKLNSKTTPKKAINKKPPQEVVMKPSKPKRTVKNEAVHKPVQKKEPQNKKVKPNTSNKFISYSIIKGNKGEFFKKRIRSIITSAVIIVLLLVLWFSTPTGVFEYIQNSYASLGSGSFPKELTGREVKYSDYADDKLFVTTDIAYSVYNSKGKTVISDAHGYSNPIMKISAARTIVLDQNGTGYKIYNLNSKIHDVTLQDKIITGDICKNGTFAVVTKPKDYAAKVNVYSKNDKLLFSWSSSKEIVTAVALSNNGKKLAVSTIYSNAGEYISKVYVFSYKKAQPILTLSYDAPVFTLKTLNSSSFAVVTNSQVDFVKWGKLSATTIKPEGNVVEFKRISGSKFIVCCESSTNNLFTSCSTYNSRFKLVKQIVYKGSADEVTYINDEFYCLDDNKVYKLNSEGEIIKQAECGYSVNKIYVKSDKKVFALSDSEITKTVLEEK